MAILLFFSEGNHSCFQRQQIQNINQQLLLAISFDYLFWKIYSHFGLIFQWGQWKTGMLFHRHLTLVWLYQEALARWFFLFSIRTSSKILNKRNLVWEKKSTSPPSHPMKQRKTYKVVVKFIEIFHEVSLRRSTNNAVCINIHLNEVTVPPIYIDSAS